MHSLLALTCCRSYLSVWVLVAMALIELSYQSIQAPALCAQVARPSAPDLLRLDSLMRRLQATDESNAIPSHAAVDGFLLPTADDVDQIMEADSQLRAEAIAWFDRFAPRQALFAAADLQELKQRLQKLPLAAVHRWLEQTAVVRERLLSSEWNETNIWLSQFIAAQAIYSPTELANLRQRIGRLPAHKIEWVLDHFQSVREERQRHRSSIVQHRQMSLENARRMQWTPRAVQAGVLAGRSSAQDPFMIQVQPHRQSPVFYRARSLSQRAADIYIYRAIYGNNALWWGMW